MYQDTWSFVYSEPSKLHGTQVCVSLNQLDQFLQKIYIILFANFYALYMTLHVKFERNQVNGVQVIHYQNGSIFITFFPFTLATLPHLNIDLNDLWMIMSENLFTVGCHTYVPDVIHLHLKVDCFEYWNKIDRLYW